MRRAVTTAVLLTGLLTVLTGAAQTRALSTILALSASPRSKPTRASRPAARSGLPHIDAGLHRRRAADQPVDTGDPLDRLRQFRTVLQRTDHAARRLFRSRQHVPAARLQGGRRHARQRHPDRARPPRSHVGRGVGRYPHRRHHRRRAADHRQAAVAEGRSAKDPHAERPGKHRDGVRSVQGRADPRPSRRAAQDPGGCVRRRAARDGAEADRGAARRARRHPLTRRAGPARRDRRHAGLPHHAR